LEKARCGCRIGSTRYPEQARKARQPFHSPAFAGEAFVRVIAALEVEAVEAVAGSIRAFLDRA
jgi:hypothetical protein